MSTILKSRNRKDLRCDRLFSQRHVLPQLRPGDLRLASKRSSLAYRRVWTFLTPRRGVPARSVWSVPMLLYFAWPIAPLIPAELVARDSLWGSRGGRRAQAGNLWGGATLMCFRRSWGQLQGGGRCRSREALRQGSCIVCAECGHRYSALVGLAAAPASALPTSMSSSWCAVSRAVSRRRPASAGGQR